MQYVQMDIGFLMETLYCLRHLQIEPDKFSPHEIQLLITSSFSTKPSFGEHH